MLWATRARGVWGTLTYRGHRGIGAMGRKSGARCVTGKTGQTGHRASGGPGPERGQKMQKIVDHEIANLVATVTPRNKTTVAFLTVLGCLGSTTMGSPSSP